MNQAQYSKLFSFLWNIANDVLVHAFEKGKYKDIIMPMLVLRRIDVLLEPTKDKVLERKAQLDKFGVTNQDQALCMVTGFPFYNHSKFTLKTLINETDPQRLRMNFIDYINGYSEDVLEIIDKFHLRQQIDNLTETGRLGSLIAKFTDSNINLSIKPVVDDEGNEVLPALDNHTMGTIFEELLRKFNEENNVTEAGEHFTPRDYVKLLADLAVAPVADKLENRPYAIYDGACGTGGILSIAQERIAELKPNATIHLFGQELQPETFATCKADMMISGVLPQTGYSLKGSARKYIAFGSTISEDGHPGETYDFCISNPPFGTPWKEDLRKKGLTDKEKKKFTDSRFNLEYDGDGDFSFIPDIGDCQMLFLANNISRMKETESGTRIVEIHSGSSLFNGKAGGGESNLRRYILENDLLEAIIAVPEKLFYNVPIATFIWVLTNRKTSNRKGKVQLINATDFKTQLRRNLGEKTCFISDNDRKRILDLFLKFEESPESRIFNNEEFGYWDVPVLRPKRDKEGNIVYKTKKGKEQEIEYARNRNESERVPLTYPGGVDAYFENEVAPYDSEARFGEPILGYELSFTKYFPKSVKSRSIYEIRNDIHNINCRISENAALNSPFFQVDSTNDSIGCWGENFPSDWKIVKGKRIFEEISVKGSANERFIAVTQDKALIYKDEGDVNFVTASDPSSQKLVCPNQFVISLRSFQGGLELSSIRGLISPAYTVFKLKDKYDNEKMRLFFKALFKSKPYVAILNSLSDSLRDGKSIKFAEIANFDYPLPPASFLDSFCELLNDYEDLQHSYCELEALLVEYKQRLVADVVTGQVNVANK